MPGSHLALSLMRLSAVFFAACAIAFGALFFQTVSIPVVAGAALLCALAAVRAWPMIWLFAAASLAINFEMNSLFAMAIMAPLLLIRSRA